MIESRIPKSAKIWMILNFHFLLLPIIFSWSEERICSLCFFFFYHLHYAAETCGPLWSFAIHILSNILSALRFTFAYFFR